MRDFVRIVTASVGAVIFILLFTIVSHASTKTVNVDGTVNNGSDAQWAENYYYIGK
jgi:hypothetical protein